jgi:hypothetical protein
MIEASGLLLVATVATVGVLHTVAPDHWAPIALIARQRGWTRRETALAAAQAGVGHVLTTLILGIAVWIAGVVFATRFGQIVDLLSSLALVAFGGWIAISAWRELRADDGHGISHGHDHPHGHHREGIEGDRLYAPLRGGLVVGRHAHLHHHGGAPHVHWHDHDATTAHEATPALALNPPFHLHLHKTSGRTALLLILGSSPMIEGIPAFFAASRYGAALVAIMAAVFALSTIATYVVLCVLSSEGLQRVSLGPLERYGEVLSGAFIALVGVAFWVWSPV